MKKSIFIAVLGVAASVASSYGQGYIAFNSYSANTGNGAIALAADGVTPLNGYTADLYFALGTVTDPVNGDWKSPVSGAFTDVGLVGVTYANGYIFGPTAILPGYSTGPISFEVVAFNGSSYLDPSTTFRGRSGAFTESTIANSASSPVTFFGDNGPGMPNFQVAPVPEPTTLALAGLGGLASLVAFRRKQA
jgi:hypothetical protein